MNKKEIILKKYENRRIYNLEEKKYVNLNDINEMILQGKKVKILDNKTGEDITNIILLQILNNILLDNLSNLSTNFLHQLIEMQEFIFGENFMQLFENTYNMTANLFKLMNVSNK